MSLSIATHHIATFNAFLSEQQKSLTVVDEKVKNWISNGGADLTVKDRCKLYTSYLSEFISSKYPKTTRYALIFLCASAKVLSLCGWKYLKRCEWAQYFDKLFTVLVRQVKLGFGCQKRCLDIATKLVDYWTNKQLFDTSSITKWKAFLTVLSTNRQPTIGFRNASSELSWFRGCTIISQMSKVMGIAITSIELHSFELYHRYIMATQHYDEITNGIDSSRTGKVSLVDDDIIAVAIASMLLAYKYTQSQQQARKHPLASLLKAYWDTSKDKECCQLSYHHTSIPAIQITTDGTELLKDNPFEACLKEEMTGISHISQDEEQNIIVSEKIPEISNSKLTKKIQSIEQPINTLETVTSSKELQARKRKRENATASNNGIKDVCETRKYDKVGNDSGSMLAECEAKNYNEEDQKRRLYFQSRVEYFQHQILEMHSDNIYFNCHVLSPPTVLRETSGDDVINDSENRNCSPQLDTTLSKDDEAETDISDDKVPPVEIPDKESDHEQNNSASDEISNFRTPGLKLVFSFIGRSHSLYKSAKSLIMHESFMSIGLWIMESYEDVYIAVAAALIAASIEKYDSAITKETHSVDNQTPKLTLSGECDEEYSDKQSNRNENDPSTPSKSDVQNRNRNHFSSNIKKCADTFTEKESEKVTDEAIKVDVNKDFDVCMKKRSIKSLLSWDFLSLDNPLYYACVDYFRLDAYRLQHIIHVMKSARFDWYPEMEQLLLRKKCKS